MENRNDYIRLSTDGPYTTVAGEDVLRKIIDDAGEQVTMTQSLQLFNNSTTTRLFVVIDGRRSYLPPESQLYVDPSEGNVRNLITETAGIEIELHATF